MSSVKEIYDGISQKERLGHFEETDRGKMKCTLTGHELPNRKEDLKNYTDKNQKFMSEAVVHKLTNENEGFQVLEDGKLYCKITGKMFNRKADELIAHLNGRRYQKDLKTGETFEDRQKKEEEALMGQSDEEKDEAMDEDEESMEEDEDEESEEDEEEEEAPPPPRKTRSASKPSPKAQPEKPTGLKRKNPGTGNKQKIKRR